MKQILQNLRSGETRLADLPSPACPKGHLKIQTTHSLISAGTERMLVEFSKGGLLAKARAQPDKVKQVLDKIKTDGLMPTVETVFKRLDEPLPLGYCNVGRVTEIGGQRSEVGGLKVGDRVVSNGPHAEVVCVPHPLCAKIPENVSDDAAAFTVLGAIGLQGIRLAHPTLGEKFVVYGTGLIGLLVVQLLRISGCEVLAVDLSDDRLKMAEAFGAVTCNGGQGDPVAAASSWTEGAGVDGVIITATAKTDQIVHQAAEMCRKRGRVVLVGVVGLNLRRSDFYEKELSFQVSCSYGPGRYDDTYEQKGRDYPLGYVRWTEQRNFQAILGAMASGQLDVSSLITDRMPFEDAETAYARISDDPSTLGVILEYADQPEMNQTVSIVQAPSEPASACVAAMIGAGNFAKMTMGPALAKTKARLKYVSARTNGAAARHIAEKYGFENATTDTDAIWNDPELNTVFITTGHNSHAYLVQKALQSGKHVFVEKPLCLNTEELKAIIETCHSASASPVTTSNIKHKTFLMIGFNRRFSPHIRKIKELLAGRAEPLAMNFTCNAGIIPPDVWVHDPETGGGRIIGEACHFIDLLSYVAGSPVVSVAAFQMGKGVAVKEDKMSIALQFEDGSVGTVNYFGNGSRQYPKETMEIFSEGRVLRMDNFRTTRGYGFGKFRKFKTRTQDKGHGVQFDAFVDRVIDGGEPLIGFDELVNVTLASFAAVTSAHEGRMVDVVM
jgi:hypothetical protein